MGTYRIERVYEAAEPRGMPIDDPLANEQEQADIRFLPGSLFYQAVTIPNGGKLPWKIVDGAAMPGAPKNG